MAFLEKMLVPTEMDQRDLIRIRNERKKSMPEKDYLCDKFYYEIGRASCRERV